MLFRNPSSPPISTSVSNYVEVKPVVHGKFGYFFLLWAFFLFKFCSVLPTRTFWFSQNVGFLRYLFGLKKTFFFPFFVTNLISFWCRFYPKPHLFFLFFCKEHRRNGLAVGPFPVWFRGFSAAFSIQYFFPFFQFSWKIGFFRKSGIFFAKSHPIFWPASNIFSALFILSYVTIIYLFLVCTHNFVVNNKKENTFLLYSIVRQCHILCPKK